MTKGACEILVNFLNQYPNLPIVAHNMTYDRDDVLRPVFKKLDIEKLMPKEQRWKCTVEMSKQWPKFIINSLDALLSYLGCEEREEDEKHDAVKDCQYAAQIYMKMAVMPPPKKAKLGWVKE